MAVAGELGFEPRFSESESDVLPLNYSPKARRRRSGNTCRPARRVIKWAKRAELTSPSLKRSGTPWPACYGQNCNQGEGGDAEKYPTRTAVIHNGAEHQRRNDAANVKARCDEA